MSSNSKTPSRLGLRKGNWGRVTGKDKRLQFPEQQCSVLGRLGDYTIVYPYGMYCDLPSGVLLMEISPGVVVPVTVVRPSDAEPGEPVFYHPETNTRIIAKANGDLEVRSETKVNVFAPETNLGAGGLAIARDTDPVEVTIPANTFLVSADNGVLNPSPVTVTGTITDGGDNTSI